MLSLDLTGKEGVRRGRRGQQGVRLGHCAGARAGRRVGARRHVAPHAHHFHQEYGARKIRSWGLPGGSEIEFEKIHPMDAMFDTPEDVPEEIREDKRYRSLSGYTIQEVADSLRDELGESCLDILVHALANGPEVRKPLVETSRAGYLEAVSASAFSMVSMVQRFGPLMREGGAVVSLTYLAGERVIPGYGGGMSSAKAASGE